MRRLESGPWPGSIEYLKEARPQLVQDPSPDGVVRHRPGRPHASQQCLVAGASVPASGGDPEEGSLPLVSPYGRLLMLDAGRISGICRKFSGIQPLDDSDLHACVDRQAVRSARPHAPGATVSCFAAASPVWPRICHRPGNRGGGSPDSCHLARTPGGNHFGKLTRATCEGSFASRSAPNSGTITGRSLTCKW